MTIEIAKAVKVRWTAKSLSATITGGIHHSRPAEQTQMPCCVFTEVSASTIKETHCGRVIRFECQFDIFNDNGDPESTGDMAALVRDAFIHSQDAQTNQLAATGLSITDARVIRDIVTSSDGSEQVYRSMFSLSLTASSSTNRNPA